MFRRFAVAACLLGLAHLGPLSAQETAVIRNWSAPPFWTPPKVAKPDDSASSAEPMAVEGAPNAMPFIATVPCRVVDTRNANGPYGGPAIVGGAAARTFNIPGGPCSIPPGAGAYSINVAAILPAADGFLTVFPTGIPQPLASDVNFLGGEVIANALIVPAGTGGSINVFANVTTHLIIDINGYYLFGALDATYINEAQFSSISSFMIIDGTIQNADISASAAIADTKLATIATAGKVADAALSANVTKVGPTIEGGEITNVARTIQIPLTTLIDCRAGSGRYFDFTSSLTDRSPDFRVGEGTDGFFSGLQFDDTPGFEDEDSHTCSQLSVPVDYVSGGVFIIRAAAGASPAEERIHCALNLDNFAASPEGTVVVAGASATYICTPTLPASVTAGKKLGFALRVSSPTTMDDAVTIQSLAFEYIATQ